MAYRASLVGAGVGALAGGVGRAAIAAIQIVDIHTDPSLLLIAAAIGIVIGAVAGATAKALLGATVEVMLSVVVFLGTWPVAALFQIAGVGEVPSGLEIAAAGALSGGVGGRVGQMAGSRRSSASG